MPNHWKMFDEKWFVKNQRLLLALLNAPILKVAARWLLRIGKHDLNLSEKITQIGPNRFSWGDRIQGERIQRTTDFRSHCKFAKRIYFSLYPLWWLFHFWDMVIANRFMPDWNLGFDTLTVYPEAGTGSTSCDGYVTRQDFGGLDWASVRDGAGTGYDQTATTNVLTSLVGDGDTSVWFSMQRTISIFDTSALTASAVISNAVESYYGSSKSNSFSFVSPDVNVYASAPASNTTLAASDYQALGTTAFSTTITYADFSIAGYNDFSLNPTGVASISKTGVTKHGVRDASHDAANVEPFIESADWNISAYSADYAGTSQDPKLVVTYTLPASSVNVIWFGSD